MAQHTTQTVREVMTLKITSLPMSASVREAARAMRDANIGDVLVVKNGNLCGIVTDRDLVVRAIAEGREPASTTLAEICSADLATVSPTDSIDHAVQLMRQQALRRLPVVENGHAIGIVSLGDLAQNRDPHSALGEISAAPPNR
jgi:signal-transduction protein with cAMP-binding, CBS, and nucleotidyltransferase domain